VGDPGQLVHGGLDLGKKRNGEGKAQINGQAEEKQRRRAGTAPVTNQEDEEGLGEGIEEAALTKHR
jgi:hypothetical protein